LEPVARQVEAFKGLPTEEMTLVVPSGSCVVFSGLLLGLAREGVHFKRIVSVQIAGYNRMAQIRSMVADRPVPDFDHIVDKTYPYARKVSCAAGGVELDSVYESKAWMWAQREVLGKGPVMFYVVGNANCTRA
jgi:1-aminocyclopropane-1-carboxylate deaminase/D-cysteine desulfhydrase-like pyridoxal-dependent ACC family enzyme